MNTRIKIKEYNNGKVEYVCEVDEFFRYSIAGQIVLSFFTLSNKDWVVMSRERPKADTAVSGGLKYEDAVYDKLEDAKAFIDSTLKKRKENEALAHGKKIKKETLEKYP